MNYTVDARETKLNCFRVTLDVPEEMKHTEISFPAWTPGSYSIRDYAGNVYDEFAERRGKRVHIEKIDKSTWNVGPSPVSFHYTVHAHRHSVQDCYVDDEHMTINGAGAFPYVRGLEQLPHRVTIIPREGWERVSTSLKSAGSWTFVADNYDQLVDSPIEIGNHEVHAFSVRGRQHELAIVGKGNIEVSKFLNDLKKIVASEVAIMGHIPYDRYVFIYHLIPGGGGGLEHLSSTHCISDPFMFRKREDYLSVLELFSHEFFHLWNVKRLRPRPLGPFDYSKENYTTFLWFSEGVTSYYELLAIRRAGISSPSEFYRALCREVEMYERTPGRRHQSPAQSSFDTWIKFYRRAEHFLNLSISYYNEGALLGMILDMMLISKTDGERRLQDVMRFLYRNTYMKGRWFEESDFLDAFERVADVDIGGFYSRYVIKANEFPVNRYLRQLGMKMEVEKEGEACFWVMMSLDRKNIVQTVLEGGPAADAHIYPNDEIIAVNGTRISDDLKDRIAELEIGKEAHVTVSRDGKIREIAITPSSRPPKIYFSRIANAGSRERKNYEAWSYSSWKEPLDYSAVKDPDNYVRRFSVI